MGIHSLSPADVVTAWELGRSRHGLDRALLLFALSQPDVAADNLADQPLGHRNRALFQLRQMTFGTQLRGYADCPACGGRQEMGLDANDLVALAPPPSQHGDRVDVDGHAFRLPTSRDLARIADEADVDQAARTLLDSCAIEPTGLEQIADTAATEWLGRVASAMDEADPLASLELRMVCDSCGHDATVAFDIAAFLWEEIEVRARGLLDEVHLLARAYGWTEAEILGLSEARRSAYLERVMA